MEEPKQNKIVLLRQMIENAERNIVAAKQILSQIDNGFRKKLNDSEVSQIIEGIFDGEKMTGLDGKTYPIPVNYASKSKLIEGDLLKLTITEDGSFVYKQISPADRRKTIGTIMKDSDEKFYVSSEGRKYNVLLASLTYFKAEEGDEVALVVPKEKISKWAAIEAVIEDLEKDKIADIADDIQENNIKKDSAEDQEDIKSENELLEDEWMPDVEEIKKEAQFDGNEDKDRGISNDLL
ncbi:MAG: hypothetical protein KAS78_01335 [Candidatus Pacebacteria bacterium]|nr:hypothetical protein [Candidatus Paceibacterota bacterium]